MDDGHLHTIHKSSINHPLWLIIWLVVWLPFFTFPYIGNLIIPIDELIFFRGVAQPPTSYPMNTPYNTSL